MEVLNRANDLLLKRALQAWKRTFQLKELFYHCRTQNFVFLQKQTLRIWNELRQTREIQFDKM